MSTIQPRRLLPLLALLAACGSPAVCSGCGGDDGGDGPVEGLPAAFRVSAEIVSIDGPVPQACTPAMADVNPAGPDWQLEFRDTASATGPRLAEVVESRNGYQIDNCDAGGCCDPVAEVAGGWSVTCRGAGSAVESVVFVFEFFTDGGGASTTTITRPDSGALICTAMTEWSTIVAL